MHSRRHRRPCCLSWSSRLFRVLICARLPGSLGSPGPLCSRRFRRSWRCPPLAVHRLLALTVSSPRELRSPSEFSVSCPPSVSPPPAPSLGFAVPLRDITGWRPCPEYPSPRCLSVRGVSHAPDGFLRHPARGFISPHSHVQGSLFRGFPSQAAAPSRRRRFSCPLAVSRRFADDVATAATNRRPALRALFRLRIRCRQLGVLTVLPTRSPLELRLLQVLCLAAVRTPSRSLSLGPSRALVRTPLRWSSAIRRRARHSLARAPTCSRFLACLPPCGFRRGFRFTSRRLNRAANRFRIQSLCEGRATLGESRKKPR